MTALYAVQMLITANRDITHLSINPTSDTDTITRLIPA
jgi:hypothetical protein